MATQKRKKGQRPVNPNNLAARTENPFIAISHAPHDLQGHGGGGGGGTELVTVDEDFCVALNSTLIKTSRGLKKSFERYPNLLAPAILRLRETGIAKTHRPIKLVEAAGMAPAGHAQIDEMLVGADAISLQRLQGLISVGHEGRFKANLSALLRIEPWSRARRNPEGTLSLRQLGRGVLRAHNYFNDWINKEANSSLELLMKKLNISTRIVTLGASKVTVLTNLDAISDERLDELLEHPAVRTLSSDSLVTPAATGVHGGSSFYATAFPLVAPPDLPTVAVFDTGTMPGHAALKGWVASKEIFVLPPDTDFEHGSNVSSLVAGGGGLNPGFPSYPCKVHDVVGLKSAGSNVSDLMLDLEVAVNKRPDVKVWNLSLGVKGPCQLHEFSEFSQKLDELSDRHNVLFVVAAGNYLDDPRRVWPGELTCGSDRISSPAESVRSLTVGSVAHADSTDSVVKINEPNPYSRRGVGPVFTPKPDIVHFGGNVHKTGLTHEPWQAGSTSTRVLTAGNVVGAGYGTSYAAPLAAAVAAHTWSSLEGNTALPPTPHLVKALLIHAAQVSSPEFTPLEKRYLGSGMPLHAVDVLYDRDDSFTLAFEAHLSPGNMRWRKTPYPVPKSLLINGKFRGEVIITAAYAPPLNGSYGAEYVRANLELNWGFLTGDKFNGRVPWEGEKGTTGLEAQQIEHGGKWSPVKTQRRVFTDGIQGGDAWALQAKLFQRAFETPPTAPLRAAIIVTLRSLDGDPNVRSQGIQALNSTNWIQNNLPVHVPVHV